MPWQMFPSEYNIKPPEWQDRASIVPAKPVSAATQPHGPTVADLPTAADEANRARSEAAAAEAAMERVGEPFMRIYGRDQPHDPMVPIPLYSYPQLHNMSVLGLKLVASKLRDVLMLAGKSPADVLLSAQPDVVIRWVLENQVALANEAGMKVTMASFQA